MKGYKWVTDKMQAFHDGYQFQYGWNEQNGRRNGLICVEGGFHITLNPDKLGVSSNAKYPPDGKRICNCYEVYYRKKDTLGKEGDKVRVSAFKLLKKKPFRAGVLYNPPHSGSYLYVTCPSNINATDTTASTNYSYNFWFTSTATA